MTWNDNSSFVSAMYYRIYYQITLANEFLRYTDSQWMDDHSFSDQEKTMITDMAAEARFLRALSYYHALDLFGNVPFVDETDNPGLFFPQQIMRKDLFNWILTELNSIETLLKPALTVDYGLSLIHI